MIKIYGIKNCDTMKKSFQWLDQNEIAYEFHDYKKLSAEAKTIKDWASKVELSLLINKKGPTFKKLAAEKQLACEKLATAIPVMLEFTSMIKRPVIEYSGGILVGFNPELWETTLK
jgi:arsenate reductase